VKKTKVPVGIRLSLVLALLAASGLLAQDAPRATRPPVDTSRSSLPAYLTPTVKAGTASKKPGTTASSQAKPSSPVPTPGRTRTPGRSGR